MKKTLAVLLIAGTCVLARCAPATAVSAFAGTKEDAVTCTATTLQSLGYYVVDVDAASGVRAERELHARNPFSGAGDTDRITIAFSRQGQSRFMVLGETVRTPGIRRIPNVRATATDRAPGRIRTSNNVRSDVDAVSKACGTT